MKILVYIFLFFCFFPYIDIIRIGTDTQPNALIAATIILPCIKNKKVNLPILLLWLLFLFSLFLIPGSNLSGFETIKNVLNYLSVPFLCFAAYNIFLKGAMRIPFGFFLFAVLTYFFVAVVQMYFKADFMSFLLNQGGRGVMLGGRGVVSLCPEPAFYGSLCLFFMVFSMIYYSFWRNVIIVPLLIIQLVFFAQSATSILVLILAAGVFLVVQTMKLRFKYMMLTASIFLAGIFLVNKIQNDIKDSRALVLMNEIYENPLLLAQIDVSAGVRIMSSVSPFLAAKHNHFLPMGMGNYRNFVGALYKSGEYPKLLNKFILAEIGRLGGGINMVLFHLGFLGLIFPLAIYLCFRNVLSKPRTLLAFIIFIILLFTQIQLMQSMIGLILASALYLSRNYRLNFLKNGEQPA